MIILTSLKGYKFVVTFTKYFIKYVEVVLWIPTKEYYIIKFMITHSRVGFRVSYPIITLNT